jgi:PRTRC genetic system protein A
LNTKEGLTGDAGLYYDFIFARTGVFIRARNSLLRATLCISPVEIRGLAPLDEEIELTHGKIHHALYDLAISTLMVNRSLEQYLAVTWEGRYHLTTPTQTREPAEVRYERVGSTILDIHSHGTMRAFFSVADNTDEQGLCLYMVVGRLDTFLPEVEMRLGVYGYFAPVTESEIFDVQAGQ